MNYEPKSRESLLFDSSNNTLEKFQDVPYKKILKEPLRDKKRAKANLFELYSSFEHFEEIKRKFDNGEVKKKRPYCPNCPKKIKDIKLRKFS